MTTTFDDLGLLDPILRAIHEQGYNQPTPIQAKAIPILLEGRDLLGVAQTGTGKTAAFALPIIDFLVGDPRPRRARKPSVLVLTPTRELASQIGESFRVYGTHVDIVHTVVFGGVGQAPQVKAMQRGVDVLVATPGRLLDLMEQGHIDLRSVEVFILDEADRMLDMGFIQPVRTVVAKLPKDRQTLLFSATMPSTIVQLASSILRDPERVEVTPPATTVERIQQSVMLVEKKDKRALLADVLVDPSIQRVLVFTRTKHGADRVVKHLRRIDEKADAIHGDKSQGARERALLSFKKGRIRVLVATDIAARGIDVQEITHVINFDLPNDPESYVHRIGRTARAGKDGVAISFCDMSEREYLIAIEKTISMEIRVETEHEYRSIEPLDRNARPVKKKAKKAAGGRSRNAGGRKVGGRKPSGKKPGPKKSGARKPGGKKPGARGAGPARSGKKRPSGPRRRSGQQ